MYYLNNLNYAGFSDDPNRLNVLLTRCKKGLIVVGHKDTLNTCDIWANWIKNADCVDDIKIENVEEKKDEKQKKNKQKNFQNRSRRGH